MAGFWKFEIVGSKKLKVTPFAEGYSKCNSEEFIKYIKERSLGR